MTIFINICTSIPDEQTYLITISLDSLYCGKWETISKSSRELDIELTMPNVKIIRGIFIYLNFKILDLFLSYGAYTYTHTPAHAPIHTHTPTHTHTHIYAYTHTHRQTHGDSTLYLLSKLQV